MNKIKRKLKTKFTKWYVRKGYVFGYDGNIPPKAYWSCPWYVKPLLFLFSPSIYDVECITNRIINGWCDRLQADITNSIINIITKVDTNDQTPTL